MFIKIWQLIILYIDQMDWRAGYLTTTEGTEDRAFTNKSCPQGRPFDSVVCYKMYQYLLKFKTNKSSCNCNMLILTIFCQLRSVYTFYVVHDKLYYRYKGKK